MPRFIELTAIPPKEGEDYPCWVNVDHVVRVADIEGRTIVQLTAGGSSELLSVRQKAREVLMQLLSASG